MNKEIKDKNNKIIKAGDYLKSDTFPENPLIVIMYKNELCGSILPNRNGIEALYEKNDGIEIITKEEADKMIKDYYQTETYKKSQVKKGYGYICHHEATWGSKNRIMDYDTVWEEIPDGATGCIKIKNNVF